MILNRGSFPMQNDPEIRVLPPCKVDADSHGEFGDSHPGRDHGLPQGQCRDRVFLTEPGGEIDLAAGRADRAAVLSYTLRELESVFELETRDGSVGFACTGVGKGDRNRLTYRVPRELKRLPQWVLWRSETRNGCPTKVPYQPVYGLFQYCRVVSAPVGAL